MCGGARGHGPKWGLSPTLIEAKFILIAVTCLGQRFFSIRSELGRGALESPFHPGSGLQVVSPEPTLLTWHIGPGFT